MAWTVSWRVAIDGRDVSNAMQPFLTDISVSDQDGTASDSCSLAFDDRGGVLKLPPKGAKLQIWLNDVLVFTGIVDSTPWELTKTGARILRVQAKGFDTRGKAKEGQLWHLDDATLQDALDKGAKAAGLSSVTVDPALGALKRDYWSPDGASFLAWGRKLAREMGATFKIRGDRAVFAKRGTGQGAAGGSLPTIQARIGENVIAVRIDPSQGRRPFAKARVRFFDRQKAEYQEKDVEIEGENGEAVNLRRFTAADGDEAEAVGQGRKSDAERESGGGTIEMELTPEAQAEGTVVLSGAREGVDAPYRITGVNHQADKRGGSGTTLTVKQPQGGAGTDTRQPANVPVPTPRPS